MKSRIEGLVSIILIFGLAAGEAQLTTGTIVGTITDQSGGAIPGATITVRNVGTGTARASVSGPSGRYEALNLPVGDYEVTASVAGFQTTTRSGIALTVGRNAVVDIVMQVGEVTQNVTVTGEAPLVETTTATVSALVMEQQIEDLPLNNRDLNQLAFLQPGVLKSPEGSSGNDGLGSKILVAGARFNQNVYLLDGVSNADFNNSAAGASEAYTGAETIKEFQIIANNYSAEYKSTPGAIISAVTKSGTNALHGSAFEFLRNDNLDAANFFDNTFGNPKPEFKRNQFGGSLGGPILRDRTFFFGSYEGLRERLNRTQASILPTVEARNGILPGLPQPIAVNPAVVPYLNLFPIPGQGNAIVENYGDGRVLAAGDSIQPTRDDFVVGRFDHRFASDKAGFLSATYNYADSERSPQGMLRDVDNRSNEGVGTQKHTFSAQHTSVFSPSVLNVFNFGYSFADVLGDLPITDRDFGDLVFVPGERLLGDLNVVDLARLGMRSSGQSNAIKSFSFKDGVSWTTAAHSFRFGADLQLFRYDLNGGPTLGAYEFSSLADFLQGTPEEFAADVANDAQRNLNQLYFGGYVQDNYAATPSLTLNLGLRYEFVTVPNEVNDKESTLLNFMDPDVTLGAFMRNPTLKSFSPRLGFAWSPGSHRTSLRGGFGIFYELPMLAHVRAGIANNPPFTIEGLATASDAAEAGTTLRFPDAYTSQFSLLEGSPGVRPFEYNAKNTTVYRWSLTLQREVGIDWVVSAGYSGTTGIHLWTGNNANINRWEGWPDNPTGPKFWPAISGTNRINPAWGQIRLLSPNTNSSYHGLALGIQKRLSRGLQAQVSYNFSKTIDQGASLSSGQFAGGDRSGFQHSIHTWDVHLKKALSSQHIQNSLVTNFTYELPLGQNLAGLPRALIAGWQLNGILTLTDGSPSNVHDRNSRNQGRRIGDTTGLTVDLVPGGDTNPTSGTSAGCTGVPEAAELGSHQLYYDPCQFAPSRIGFFGTLGRNTLILPGVASFDLSVMKNFPISETQQLQFRAEFFNATNRVNFGTPNLNPFLSNGVLDPNAGQIQTTRTKAREIQFGLRYSF